MELNYKKSKMMIFNFTKDYQFTTSLSIEDNKIQVVNETKLLGTVITSDLKWKRNTEEIIKKAYARMQIVRKVAEFSSKSDDLVTIYKSYVRSILEQSCQVWHSSLSDECSYSIERVQKAAVRIILKDKFMSYEHSLEKLNSDTLYER